MAKRKLKQKKKNPRKKPKSNFFLLSWRKLWMVIIVGFISIILHNAFYAVFGVEEFVFFIIVVFLVPIYFIISIIYTLIKKSKGGGKC